MVAGVVRSNLLNPPLLSTSLDYVHVCGVNWLWANSMSVTPHNRYSPAQEACRLGARILQDTFRVHESSRSAVVEQLLNSIITRASSSVTHYIGRCFTCLCGIEFSFWNFFYLFSCHRYKRLLIMVQWTTVACGFSFFFLFSVFFRRVASDSAYCYTFFCIVVCLEKFCWFINWTRFQSKANIMQFRVRSSTGFLMSFLHKKFS